MNQLQKIRASLIEKENKKNEPKFERSEEAKRNYALWKTEEGRTTMIRFLPDKDPESLYFWKEKLTFKIPFKGIVGGTDKEVFVSFPCMKMWEEHDPIVDALNPWWSDDDKKDLARKYYFKRSYVFSGLVITSGFLENDAPENPIRTFNLSPTLYSTVKDLLLNDDIEHMPTDYNKGRDFKIIRNMKGGFSNYAASGWTFKDRKLNPEEMAQVEKWGLVDLKSLLPERPDDAKLAVHQELFESSVAGDAFDPKRFEGFKAY